MAFYNFQQSPFTASQPGIIICHLLHVSITASSIDDRIQLGPFPIPQTPFQGPPTIQQGICLVTSTFLV